MSLKFNRGYVPRKEDEEIFQARLDAINRKGGLNYHREGSTVSNGTTSVSRDLNDKNRNKEDVIYDADTKRKTHTDMTINRGEMASYEDFNMNETPTSLFRKKSRGTNASAKAFHYQTSFDDEDQSPILRSREEIIEGRRALDETHGSNQTKIDHTRRFDSHHISSQKSITRKSSRPNLGAPLPLPYLTRASTEHVDHPTNIRYPTTFQERRRNIETKWRKYFQRDKEAVERRIKELREHEIERMQKSNISTTSSSHVSSSKNAEESSMVLDVATSSPNNINLNGSSLPIPIAKNIHVDPSTLLHDELRDNSYKLDKIIEILTKLDLRIGLNASESNRNSGLFNEHVFWYGCILLLIAMNIFVFYNM